MSFKDTLQYKLAMKSGFSMVPHAFLLLWREIGLTVKERDFLIYVMSNARNNYEVADYYIAEGLGCTIRWIRIVKQNLRDKKYPNKRGKKLVIIRSRINPKYKKGKTPLTERNLKTQYNLDNLFKAIEIEYEKRKKTDIDDFLKSLPVIDDPEVIAEIERYYDEMEAQVEEYYNAKDEGK